VRASELLALDIPDVDLQHGVVTVRRGKGGKGRRVGVGPQTGAAIDRYLRVRRHHRLAQRTTALWLTETGGKERLGYHGLRVALLARAKAAGIEDFPIHKMRHTFASRWLDGKGSSRKRATQRWVGVVDSGLAAGDRIEVVPADRLERRHHARRASR
jgi:integrase